MDDIVNKLIKLNIKPLGSGDFLPLTGEEVAKLEDFAGTRLVAGYKQFLMRFGRSMFSNEVNCSASAEPLYFGSFYGFSELMTAIDGLRDTLPTTIIPIGDDSGDIVFCLGVGAENTGKVYVYNNSFGWHADAANRLSHGERYPSDIRYQTVQEIAPSFEDFVGNMKGI